MTSDYTTEFRLWNKMETIKLNCNSTIVYENSVNDHRLKHQLGPQLVSGDYASRLKHAADLTPC